MSNSVIAVLIFFLLTLSSCDLVNPPECTLDFRSVVVEVNGAQLSKTYTIAGQADTLHKNENPVSGNFYTIIDDNNQSELENSEMDVVFHGYMGDSLAVSETYEVGADECHIFKVSGKNIIEL
ncbi:MAG: hypothetical protein MRZ79_05030 [Bacteroidia bacterium]|nr:hypothetical protein [Bacteroidia bacterium]